MSVSHDIPTPVRAKAILVEPVFMTVLWMDDSALQDIQGKSGGNIVGTPIEKIVPMAEVLGLTKALHEAVETGVAQHLRTDLVSTAKGSMGVAASVYRLPDGKLLVLMEQDFKAKRRL